MQQCAICSKGDDEVYRLVKCPSCYKLICESCAVRYYGRYFCSDACSRAYFYVDDDDV